MFWALPLVGIILILKGRIIFILVKAWERIRLGRAAAEHAILFDQSPMHPNLNILVAGDSTAVGVGSDGPQETIAGFFGQAYPNARVVNVGRSGSHAHQLLQQLEPLQHERFDFAVTLIGGNDVVHFTNLDTLPEHLDAYLIALKQIARHNII
jgi:lysophospholipase L1-like esterase